ncbi:unnamed protein product [Phytophthora lilii]|uniref:Unnamed protein product n=1 Tax=Phytophthora lilii TaxID=2077276 RepID=A0A9W6X209_9STRA|nr:unnamed protein product [Phytophthora lilii]
MRRQSTLLAAALLLVSASATDPPTVTIKNGSYYGVHKKPAANDVTSYSYVFNVLVIGLTQYIGATHFQEVAFVFYNLQGNGYNNSV